MSDLNGREHDQVTLVAADAAAVDAILGGEAAAAEPVRQQRAEQWLKVLDGAEVPAAPSDLLVRTLGAVADADRLKIPAPTRATYEMPVQPSRWRRRMAEFGAMAVAAALLLVVTMSGLGQMKKSQMRVACVQNQKKISQGIAMYAGTFGGQTLPMVALPSNRNWLHGSADGARNNGMHLMPLVTGNFVPLAAFYCPGTPESAATMPGSQPVAPSLGYSYRLMTLTDRPTWDGKASTIILTDRNPLLADPTKKGAEAGNSDNHGGHGNNVIHGDGSVTWTTSPSIGPDGDNIWTVGTGKDRLLSYKGTEMPASAADVFVCP